MSDRIGLAKYIDQSLTEGASVEKLVNEIATYLLQKRKLADFESLMRDVLNIRANKGYLEATIISKYPLSSSVINHIKSVIKKESKNHKKIVINTTVDPELLGGVKVFFDNSRIDLSLDNKINKFRELAVS